MHMELMACESVIENEINMGLKQKDIAQTYAMAMVSSWPTDWARVNKAIMAKWPKGLNRVKEMAHKIVAEKRREALARMAASN
jgi:hypothetical protein